METPDTSMILNAAQYNAAQMQQLPSALIPSMEKAQQSAGNELRLQAGVLEIKQQQQEASDNQKLTQALQSVDPNSPNYADDVVRAAQNAGVSGKALLNLKQNLYVAEGERT